MKTPHSIAAEYFIIFPYVNGLFHRIHPWVLAFLMVKCCFYVVLNGTWEPMIRTNLLVVNAIFSILRRCLSPINLLHPEHHLSPSTPPTSAGALDEGANEQIDDGKDDQNCWRPSWSQESGPVVVWWSVIRNGRNSGWVKIHLWD